jgi:hypothetical protein
MNETLHGHTTPETAFVVDDYPYGFRLRTKIRYWLETKKGHGQRFVSQTLNPKTGQWNKPKSGTYEVIQVMTRNPDNGHVSTECLRSGGWDDEEKIIEFETRHAPALGEYERKAIRYIRATNAANEKIIVTIHEAGSNEAPQTREEQAAIMNAVIRSEYARIG